MTGTIGSRIVALAKVLDDLGKPFAKIHVQVQRQTLRMYFEETPTGKFYIRRHQIIIVGAPARAEAARLERQKNAEEAPTGNGPEAGC